MVAHSSLLAWRIPGTGGAWWAAVYGVAQSRTRLQRPSGGGGGVLIWGSESSSKSTSCRQDSAPRNCRTLLSIFLLALAGVSPSSEKLPSGPNHKAPSSYSVCISHSVMSNSL